jgi:hypothetical protein
MKALSVLVACALLGANGAASAATYTLSLTQPGSGALVAPDSVSSLSISPVTNSGNFSQLLDALSPTISADLFLGTVLPQVDFTTALSPSLLETFAFQNVLFTDVMITGANEPSENVSFKFESETTSTNTAPLPAALPLFASGLGALGLLGWRRKRKARGSLLGTA